MIKVAVDAPLRESLTYEANSNFEVKRGDIVQVPLGKRIVLGFVLDHDLKNDQLINSEPTKKFEIKSIAEIETEWPPFFDPHLKWLEWVAKYYLHPIGRVIQLALPPLKKTNKLRQSKRPPVIAVQKNPEVRFALTDEQNHCLEKISEHTNFKVHLLHGVTGSGKTEVYLQLFSQCLLRGQKGLFLLPEISLTPQLVQRFSQRFGDKVAVLHSQLTDRERTNQWWEIVEGEKSILIGARSALFCPIKNLGLIIVDEEQESSFKQDEKLKYHGRDAAIMLAQFVNCSIVLGSATPSLETWNNAKMGKYLLHQLTHRVHKQDLPSISIVDMRLEKDNALRPKNLPQWLSLELYSKMVQTLENGQQVALLLNRRGLSNTVFCKSCGFSAECPNCDIHLTLHAGHHLVCHYCDYVENFSLKCPDCHEGEMIPLGIGTEKVENDLQKLFPAHVLARADRDEISNRVEMESLIDRMEQKQIDILVGTQMIAKGLDFPHLNLVGLVLADVGFNLPDFRATEKSFQLMTQMSGRPGRANSQLSAHGKNTGEVVIQTFNTEHDSLKFIKKHDFIQFAEYELLQRQQLAYPPYSKLISLRIVASDQQVGKQMSILIGQKAQNLKDKFAPLYNGVQILGPAAAPLARIKNQFRFHLLLKSVKAIDLNGFVSQLLSNQKWLAPKSKIVIDVDPMNLL